MTRMFLWPFLRLVLTNIMHYKESLADVFIQHLSVLNKPSNESTLESLLEVGVEK